MKFNFEKLTQQEVAGFSFLYATLSINFSKASTRKMLEVAFKCLDEEVDYKFSDFYSEDGNTLARDDKKFKFYGDLVADFIFSLCTHLKLAKNGDTNDFLKTDPDTNYTNIFYINDISQIGEVLEEIGETIDEYYNRGVEFEPDFDLDDTDLSDDFDEIDEVILDDLWFKEIDELDLSSLDDD